MNDHLDLGVLTRELQALETEAFEIVDYRESSDLLGAGIVDPGSTTSSCTSTCSNCSAVGCVGA